MSATIGLSVLLIGCGVLCLLARDLTWEWRRADKPPGATPPRRSRGEGGPVTLGIIGLILGVAILMGHLSGCVP